MAAPRVQHHTTRKGSSGVLFCIVVWGNRNASCKKTDRPEMAVDVEQALSASFQQLLFHRPHCYNHLSKGLSYRQNSQTISEDTLRKKSNPGSSFSYEEYLSQLWMHQLSPMQPKPMKLLVGKHPFHAMHINNDTLKSIRVRKYAGY